MLDAGVAALLGDRAEAVEWLKRYLRGGSRHRTALHYHASLESLHQYAGYQELLRVRDDPEHRVRYSRR